MKLGKRRVASVLKPAIRINLDALSLRKTSNMLSKLNFTSVIWQNDAYFVFSVEPLHAFCLGISKTLEECTVVYLTSGERQMPSLRNKCEGKKREQNEMQISHSCNNFLVTYERDYSMSGFHVDFSTTYKLVY